MTLVVPDEDSPAFDSTDDAAEAVSRNSCRLKTDVPEGWRLSGIVHSHPSRDEAAQWFSPEDIAVATRLNVPSYIRFCDGSIRRYTPGETETELYRAVVEGQQIAGSVSHGDPMATRRPSLLDWACKTIPRAQPTKAQ